MAIASPLVGVASISPAIGNQWASGAPWYINTIHGRVVIKQANSKHPRTAAPANARVQTRVRAEATSPAPKARQIELKFTSAEIATSSQPTPPPKRHTVKT